MTGSDGRTIEFRRRFVLRRARFGLIGTVKRLLASKKLSHLPSLVLGVALDIKNFLFGSGFQMKASRPLGMHQTLDSHN